MLVKQTAITFKSATRNAIVAMATPQPAWSAIILMATMAITTMPACQARLAYAFIGAAIARTAMVALQTGVAFSPVGTTVAFAAMVAVRTGNATVVRIREATPQVNSRGHHAYGHRT